MKATSSISDICNRESERLTKYITNLLNKGYLPRHWWDNPIQPGDKVVTIGFFSLVKRKTCDSVR